MKSKTLNLLSLIIFSLAGMFTVNLQAAPITTVPYICSFEEQAENNQWVLNTGPIGAAATNKWAFSNASAYLGSMSMLISNNGGVDAQYSNSQIAIVAYREFTLPAGNYDISFSWRAQGQENDALLVCWLPANTPTNSSAFGEPGWSAQALSFDGDNSFYGNSEWSTEQTTVYSSGIPMKLVFMWKNDTESNLNPPACVDFVQVSTSDCATPTNLNVSILNTTDATVTWQGSASEYELQYRAFGEDSIVTISGITGNTYVVPSLISGMYDFWIRSICTPDTSVWVNCKNVLVYNAGASCIDFIDFDAPTTHCTTGEYENPYQTTEIVDYGYKSINSRHTFHYNPGETDPRTENKLTTVPPGDIVAVRLGNWDNGAEAESITYSIPLDPGSQTVIILKYAVVFEAPGHGADSDPKFIMEVMDQNNNLLDAVCTRADFWADISMAGYDGWYTCPGERGNVLWKDWTTVGMNLTPWAGQTVKIRLTTKDCDPTYHCGYAYYTLACAEGSISGLSCGDIKSTSVEAPNGFEYEWYKKYQTPKVVVSTDQELPVDGSDTATYCCDVIFTGNPNCRFTLEAALLPRYPNAQFVPKWDPEACDNYVLFQNSSGVVTDRGPSTEKCSSYKWDFGNGETSSEESPRIKYPEEGGTYVVKLVVGISDDMCKDTLIDTLIVPPIGITNDTVCRTICQGDHVIFNGQKFTREGQYAFNFISRAKCDSSIVLDLKVVDRLDSIINDTICFGESYVLNGQPYTKSGTYMATFESVGGCDSVVTLNLIVKPKITFTVTAIDVVNGPKSGEIIVEGADSSWTYTINGVENADFKNLDAGSYTIIYYDEDSCESDPVTVQVRAQCLTYNIAKKVTICADDVTLNIPFEILDGGLRNYELQFDTQAQTQGFVDATDLSFFSESLEVSMPNTGHIRPDNYNIKIILNDFNCEPITEIVTLEVLYPSSIMSQKWNDVIALLSPKYNGGYDFVDNSYRWFRNGLELKEEMGNPYLYLNGTNFNLNDIYSVGLTRKNDNERMIMSCEMMPIIRTDVQDYPTVTVTYTSQKLPIQNASGDGTATWYDYLGRMISSQEIIGETPEIDTPEIPGLYLLEIKTLNNRTVYKIHVK